MSLFLEIVGLHGETNGRSLLAPLVIDLWNLRTVTAFPTESSLL